jgi:UDP-N-acetylmuramoylalanine--D-glutamate ligase
MMNTLASFADKRIVILGLGRQGLALARFFHAQNATVVISDRAPRNKLASELAALADLPVELALGGHPFSLLDSCDLLCLSGGVPAQLEIVQEAVDRGIPLTNDALMTLQMARARGLGPIIAITGSSGKTTTTTLVGEMIAAAGLTGHVGGNIGTPLLDRMAHIAPGEPIILELSSFQLELFDPAVSGGSLDGVGPDIAALLNITPNHLDRHADMADYADAKLNLLRHLPGGATVVLNADDAVTGRLLGGGNAPALPAEWRLEALLDAVHDGLLASRTLLRPYSCTQTLVSGGWLAEDKLVLDGESFCHRSEVKLRGDHNLSNLLAAAVISEAAGVESPAMGQVASTFAGVPHRLEVVADQNGVVWINDSIATSPERAVAALRCFKVNGVTLILLAGGKDKQLPWGQFADEVSERVNMLIGFGDAGPMIVRTVQERAEERHRKAPSCALVQRLDEAVDLAHRVAGGPSVVLLSPGGTSYDAYRDFEERGEHFRSLVHAAVVESRRPV